MFLGIAHQVVGTKARGLSVDIASAYYVSAIVPGSAAQRAGLLAHDYILSFDGLVLDNMPRAQHEAALRTFLREQKSVGEDIHLDVLRLRSQWSLNGEDFQQVQGGLDHFLTHPGADTVTQLTISHDSMRFPLTATLGRRSGNRTLPAAEDMYPSFEALKAPYGARTLGLIAGHNVSEDWSQFLEKHADDERWEGQMDDWCTLDILSYIRLRPDKLLAVSAFLADSLSGGVSNDVVSAPPLLGASRWLVAALPHGVVRSIQPKTQQDDLDTLLSELVDWVERIGMLRDVAFSALSEQEQLELSDLGAQLYQQLKHSFYIDGMRVNEQTNTGALRFFQLLSRVDLGALLAAARLAERLHDYGLQTRVYKLIRHHPEAWASAPLAVRDSAYGRVVLGGFADNEYREHAALLIDVGGDDRYFGAAGSATPQHPVSLMLDFSGDDRYSATTSFAQGGAFMGIAMLVDRQGDDTYLSALGAQGSAWIGVGALWDMAGNDHYASQYYAQGSGFMGLGILYDGGGDDVYRATLYAQGVGGPCGIGVLHDLRGDDDYRSGGVKPSTYNDDVSGSFQGASLGFGIGFRGHARGGLGVVLDDGGDDYYETGNFGLGVGYFYGLGLVRDAKGDDRYYASRYGLGAAAHSAAGVLIDDSGDDIYDGNYVALVGAGWDLSLAGFWDRKGDDTYMNIPRRFNIGVAAHNSFSLMIDAAGKDSYVFSIDPQIWSNDYHGGTSFAFRYDLGGRDKYVGKGRNSDFAKTGAHGFSMDLP